MIEASTPTQKGRTIMLKKDVKIGTVYDAKISGTVSPVRIRRESQYGGWEGINLNTGRVVRIKSAQKLRGESSEATRMAKDSARTMLRSGPENLRGLTQEDLTQAASKDAASIEDLQATYDRHRAHQARLIRYYDECPDGDPRKPGVKQEMRFVNEKIVATENEISRLLDEDPTTEPVVRVTMNAGHFRIIAEILKELARNNSGLTTRVVLDFADRLAATNPRFDRARFLKACSPIGTDLSEIDADMRAGR